LPSNWRRQAALQVLLPHFDPRYPGDDGRSVGPGWLQGQAGFKGGHAVFQVAQSLADFLQPFERSSTGVGEIPRQSRFSGHNSLGPNAPIRRVY
jgi:hypothetical protein